MQIVETHLVRCTYHFGIMGSWNYYCHAWIFCNAFYKLHILQELRAIHMQYQSMKCVVSGSDASQPNVSFSVVHTNMANVIQRYCRILAVIKDVFHIPKIGEKNLR